MINSAAIFPKLIDNINNQSANLMAGSPIGQEDPVESYLRDLGKWAKQQFIKQKWDAIKHYDQVVSPLEYTIKALGEGKELAKSA
jgi:hypothetical protein